MHRKLKLCNGNTHPSFRLPSVSPGDMISWLAISSLLPFASSHYICLNSNLNVQDLFSTCVGFIGNPWGLHESFFLFLQLILKLGLVYFSAQADTTHPLTKHRKIASSFRDSSLFDIFTLSCNLLKQVRW